MGLGSKKVKDSGGLSAWNDDPKFEVKSVARRARRAHDDKAVAEGLEEVGPIEEDVPTECRWCNGPLVDIGDGSMGCADCDGLHGSRRRPRVLHFGSCKIIPADRGEEDV